MSTIRAREIVTVLPFRRLAGTPSVWLKTYVTSSDGKVSPLWSKEFSAFNVVYFFPCLWRHEGIYYRPVQKHTFPELHYCGKNPGWNDDTPRSDTRYPDLFNGRHWCFQFVG